MKTQIEAVNDLLDAVRKFVVLTRGAIGAPERLDLRVVVDGARDDLVGALAVIESTFPHGEGEVPDWYETAQERLRVIEGLNRVNAGQAEQLRALEKKIEDALAELNADTDDFAMRIDDAVSVLIRTIR